MDMQAISLGQAPQPETRGSIVAGKAPAPTRETQAEQKPVPIQAPTPQQLQKAVENINRKLSGSTALLFSVDQVSGQTVVRVTDKETGETIRQFPSEAALAIAESIGEFQKGLLLKQEA